MGAGSSSLHLAPRTLTQEDPGDNQITLEEIMQLVSQACCPPALPEQAQPPCPDPAPSPRAALGGWQGRLVLLGQEGVAEPGPRTLAMGEGVTLHLPAGERPPWAPASRWGLAGLCTPQGQRPKTLQTKCPESPGSPGSPCVARPACRRPRWPQSAFLLWGLPSPAKGGADCTPRCPSLLPGSPSFLGPSKGNPSWFG